MGYLTLLEVAQEPELISKHFATTSGSKYILRPLLQSDVEELAEFLQSLSALTRDRWIIEDYTINGAKQMCDDIAKYDKLRLVITPDLDEPKSVLALLEFSFGIPQGDVERFETYAIELSEEDHARFGVCVREDMHRSGLFSSVMSSVIKIAKSFGKSSIILWGGVLTDNIPAVRAYQKVGFAKVGEFADHYEEGRFCHDMVLDIR